MHMEEEGQPQTGQEEQPDCAGDLWDETVRYISEGRRLIILDNFKFQSISSWVSQTTDSLSAQLWRFLKKRQRNRHTMALQKNFFSFLHGGCLWSRSRLAQVGAILGGQWFVNVCSTRSVNNVI